MQSFIKNLFVPVISLLVLLSGCGGGRSQAPPPESPSAPLVSFSASSISIISGDFVTLTWKVTNATTVSISPNVNEADDGKYLALVGACTLVLQNTTTYVLTAQGQGGTTTKQLTVEVRAAAPTISLVAEPAEILPGASATLRWSTAGITELAIDHEIGKVTAGVGSVQVSPTATTTYTATGSGQGGVVTAHDLAEIPLAHRSFANIAFLVPGTVPVEPSDPTKARITAVSFGGSSGLNDVLSVDGIVKAGSRRQSWQVRFAVKKVSCIRAHEKFTCHRFPGGR